MSTIPAVSSTLASFAADVAFDDAAPEVQYAARRTTVNVVALATAASRRPSVERVLELHRTLAAPRRFSLFGREEGAGALAAPLINGMAAHVDDYDDTHLASVAHPGAPIVPAALAAAQYAGADGQTTMSGILAGVEVGLRIVDGLSPSHIELGWHPTGTAGHLGAAVAAGRVLGFNADQMLSVLGLIATQAGGLLTVNGTMTKALHPAKAAANGFEAALLVARGWPESGDRPIESPYGFAEATSPVIDLDRMVSDLGQRWEIENNALKPYACGIVSHAAIDAAIALRDRVAPEDIAEVEARVPEIVLVAMGIEDPRDALETKFSVYHCVTVGFLDGAGGPPQFSDDRAVAEDVVSLRRRVRTVIDPSVPKGAVVLRVRTNDGRELVEEVLHATASVERPMTDAQFEDKVRRLLVPAVGPQRTDEVIAATEGLGNASGVDDLFASTWW